MARSISYYLDDDTASIVEDRSYESASCGLKTILMRYAELVRRDMPELSEAELDLCRDALNGVCLRDPTSVNYAVHEVEDGIRLNKLDTKWEVDGPVLVKKLGALTYGQRLALVDAIEREACLIAAVEHVAER